MRNKKKQAKHDEPEIAEVAAIPQNDDGVSQLNPYSNKGVVVTVIARLSLSFEIPVASFSAPIANLLLLG